MTDAGLARLQFGATITYHFLFVPITIGLSFLLAIMESLYWHRRDPKDRKVLDFFGRLFLLNFAVGVVTGILQEFQFGMNWSEYSRYVGDVFGAPLAIESLAAFFLESTFLGVWIFGWDRISPRLHAWSMWLVAIGTSLSAFWILAANSFMQEPVGYQVKNGHAEMTNVWALLGNPQQWVEFPHTELAALATGGFFVAGISAYYLARNRHVELFLRPFRLGAAVALICSTLVVVVGHDQAQHLVRAQPMKMAASEALWHTSGPHAAWSLVTNIDSVHQKNTMTIAIPDLLSILAYNRTTGKVLGIDTLQRRDVQRYGPGWYVPPVIPTYWSFRLMILIGFLMIAGPLWGLWLDRSGKLLDRPRYLRAMVWAIGLPLLGNTMGWVMTEVGRQPWLVYGLLQTTRGVSPSVPAGEIWLTLGVFLVLYGVLGAVEVSLVTKYVRLGPQAKEPPAATDPTFNPL